MGNAHRPLDIRDPTLTCIFSYLVASVIDDKPVLSIAVSVLVTTALLGLLYRPLKSNWENAEADAEPSPSAT